MQIVIDTRYCPCRTLKDECDISGEECYEEDACSTCPLIRNGGTPLPKGHGRLKDIDAIIDTLDSSDRDIYVKECLEEDTPTIIPADTESEEE